MCDQYEYYWDEDEMEQQQEVTISAGGNATDIIEETDYGNEMIEDTTINQDDLKTHNAIIRVEEDGSRMTYYCMVCDFECETEEIFEQMHLELGQQLEPAWEAISTTEDNAELEEITDEDNAIVEIQEEYEDTESMVVEDSEEYEKVEESEKAVESPRDVLYCEQCNTIFENLELAGAHICPALNIQAPVTDANLFGFTCTVCERFFTSIRALNIHSRTHKARRQPPTAHEDAAPGKTAVCKICKTTFNSIKNLKLHAKIHNEKPLKSIEEALPAGAIKSYSVQDQFFCELCRKSFAQSLLTVHKKMHQNLKDYSCDICNKIFENAENYAIHMRVHNGKPETEEVLRRAKEEERRRHNSKNSDSPKLPFACQYCGHCFRRPHEKVKHERVHTGEKPYKCEVCGKCFRVSYSLTLHLRTHTNVRPYMCPTCNKSFKSQNVYSHHLKIHEEARNFKCEYCQKSFHTAVQLCSHRKTHYKPYNCPLCRRPFSSLYAVKLHMKTHNNKHKTFDRLKHCCAVCGATYGCQNPLHKHMREMHGIDSNFELAEVERKNVSEIQETVGNSDEDNGVNLVNQEFILEDMPIEIVQPNEVIVGTVLDEEIVSWAV